MPIHLRLFLAILGLLFFISCSSSHSSNDSDLIPDADADTQDSETVDDDSDAQGGEIIDDSDETPDSDIDADSADKDAGETSYCDEEDEEELDDEDTISSYTRCYDEIPDEPYEGLFADKKIESQIKKNLGYDDDYELTEEDLEKITEIVVSSKDLRGFEKLINLEYINFKDTDGNIYDFTPLSKLKKLNKVLIYFRPPAELSPNEHPENMTCLDASFALLTTIEILEIQNTHLKNVDPIEQLVNLTSLQLGHYNKIESLPKNIGNLQKLEWFSFSGNNVKDIKPLKSLTNLKRLFFHDNSVEDICPIKKLINLTKLGAQSNKIKDISPVTNLVNLTYLGLNENLIEKIPKEITNLKKLQTLELDYNNISNLPDLKGLDSLDEMWLAYNNLSDEDFIKFDELEHAWFLDISFNKIIKVPVMKNVKSLQYMLLVGNKITDLSGFADNQSFPALKQLELQYNRIEIAEPLRKREGLSRLSIYNNCIKDLSPLEELKEKGTYVSGMNEQLESCENTTTLEDGE